MSYYIYVCYDMPNDGVIKVGKSIDIKSRCAAHGLDVMVTHVFELETSALMTGVELAFHRAWRAMAMRQQIAVCEWYGLFPDEAANWIRLYTAAHSISCVDRTDFAGPVHSQEPRCFQFGQGNPRRSLHGFAPYDCECGFRCTQSNVEAHHDCVPSKGRVAALQLEHQRDPDWR